MSSSSMSSRRVLALTASVLVVLLEGCGDPAPKQSSPPSSPPASTSPAKPKQASLPGEMVAAVAAGKSASVISVHFALGSPPKVGTPLPVQIAIVPHQPFTSVGVHFEIQDGLTMPVGEDFGPVDNVEPEKPLSHQLMLLPAKEGMFMVTAAVDTIGEEGNVVRIFSIPVIVGAAQPAATATPR
jgi:hypothetical protein